MKTKISCDFADSWSFETKTPDAAEPESRRQMAGRNKAHLL